MKLFWFVILPVIILSIPLLFVYEIIDNARRKILFDFS
jgi:hypothetical protein